MAGENVPGGKPDAARPETPAQPAAAGAAGAAPPPVPVISEEDAQKLQARIATLETTVDELSVQNLAYGSIMAARYHAQDIDAAIDELASDMAPALVAQARAFAKKLLNDRLP